VTAETLTYVIYEANKRVGSVESPNTQDALLDFWTTFLSDDDQYADPRTVGNMLQCVFKGQPRTFIARAEP
jgi:hypothetical protein